MPAVGSSSSSISGSLMSAMASSSNFCCPKERSPASSSLLGGKADKVEQLNGALLRLRLGPAKQTANGAVLIAAETSILARALDGRIDAWLLKGADDAGPRDLAGKKLRRSPGP